MRIWLPLLVLLFVWPSAAMGQEPPEEGMKLFEAKTCSGCHTIGGGKKTGPDLKGVLDRRDEAWVKKFIKQPSAMLASDDAAKALLAEHNNVPMPDLGLADAEVDALVEVLKVCSATDCFGGAERLTPASELTPEQVLTGIHIFTGEQPLANGGPACISCHTVKDIHVAVGGGNLALELTTVFGKLGDDGLAGALKAPGFPLMNKIFPDKPLTAEEVLALRAMFYQSNRGGLVGLTNVKSWPSVPLLAAAGAILMLILLNAAWARRHRGVRTRLVSESRREVD